jgi:hypothetical protein
MSKIKGFFRFWYDFIVGDDWRVAAMIVVGIAATALLSHNGVNAWWLMPIVVITALAASLRRATRET